MVVIGNTTCWMPHAVVVSSSLQVDARRCPMVQAAPDAACGAAKAVLPDLAVLPLTIGGTSQSELPDFVTSVPRKLANQQYQDFDRWAWMAFVASVTCQL
jgi:hypothetical protein